MFKRIQKWATWVLIVPMLLGQPITGNAQNPVKDAAANAKVTPDLLSVQTNNGAPTPSPERGLEIQNPYVIIDNAVAIEAVASDGNGQALLQRLQALGLRDGASYKRMVSGYLPIDKIDDLKDVPNLKFARPAYEPQHNVGAVTSQGDKALRADAARQTYGVTGAGSKIGVISDSYDKLGGAAAGVASGDLPSGVQVLLDFLQPSATDEGRAMAELIHDVAPGAALAFHTANGGQAVFAKGIKDLAAAGCNIIVDDVIYFAEPFFQDGIIAQAADEVVTINNASYFSSAGNQARSSYQAGFVNSGVTIPGYGQAHNFGGGDTRQRITIPARGSFRMILQWDDPFFSVSGAPGAQTDLDILVYSATSGALVGGSFADNILSGDPVEGVFLNNTGSMPLNIDITIAKYAGPDPNLIKWVNFGSRTVAIEYDTRSSASYGHSNSLRAISVGAAAYFNTPAFNANLTTAVVEGFSSAGGTPTLFTTTGERINGAVGVTRQKPDITAVDGGNTTFFGQDFEPDGFPNFFGTSAAAPHAAAVAALMQQKASNGLAPSSILSIMKATALDMDDPVTPGFDTGFDFRTGYGFIQADRVLQAIGQPLALVQPEYNCTTGQITFQTTGGDGSLIEYRGIGITDWNPNPVQFVDAPVRADPNSTTVYLVARQNGREVTYTFNFRAYCQGSNGNQPPVLANPIGNQFAQRGNFFAFQFPATTFSDPNGDPLVYSATDLPDGLTFDAANRRISGTPTQAGTFPVTIKATDPGNLSAQAMFSIIISPTGSTQPLALIAPLYDCLTGNITFRTINGDGSTITYSAIGVRRNAETDAMGVVEDGIRGDPKPIVITATQSGVSVTFIFDLLSACGGGTPPSGTFALVAPAYDCATGIFTFQVANVASGKTVEYYAVPGITDWTTNPTHQFNNDLRTVGDVRPFTLRARYVGEPGSEVTLEWVRPAPCSPGARLAARELGSGLRVTVLGNPARDEQVEIDVMGARGKSLQLRVSNGRGEWISDQTVELSGATQRQRVSIGRSPGIYLLQVGTDTERKTVKIVRQ